MRSRRTEPARLSGPLEPRIAFSEQHVLFRTGVFLLSVAVGFCFTHALYGLWHAAAPSLAADHGKAKSLVDMLQNLLSGFSRD